MKDLNVGLDSIIKFLDKKGEKVESNPNVKLTDHQYELLVEEFDHDKKLKSEAEQQAQQRRKEKEERKEEVAPKEEFIPTVLDEDDKPQFKTVGKIDLDGGKKPASPKEEPEPQEEEIPAPQGNLNRNQLLRNNRTNRRLLRRRNHRNNRTRLLPRRNNLRMCSLWELPC